MAATEALLGAVGSAGACLVSNPIDVARVRLQLQSLSRLEVARQPWSSGLRAAMGYNVAFNGVRFFLFEPLSAVMPTPVAGCLSGGLAGLMSSPLAKARTLQQSGTQISVLAVMRDRPFAGASAWAVRNGGHTGVIFTLWNASFIRLREGGMSASWANITASLGAASISCVVMNPIDVVATRIFHQEATRRDGAKGPRAYKSALDCAWKTFRGEGARGLYAGLGANLVRIVPHTVLTFGIVETLRSFQSFAFWKALHHSRGSV